MDIKTYQSQLPLLRAARVVPLVWGAHGIGKSSMYQDYFTVNLRLGNMEVGDVVGFPVERGDTMEFLAPDWWVSLDEYCAANPDKVAVLHLDELNHIRKDMQSIIFQLVLDRRINERILHQNVQIVASANPPTDDYPGVFDFTNRALLDRFCHVSLHPSLDEWLTWASAAGIDRDRVAFLRANPQFLEMKSVPYDALQNAHPSRRSQEMADRLVKLGAVDELVYGMIGIEAHEAFKAFKAEQEKTLLAVDEILNFGKREQAKLETMIKKEQFASIDESVAALVIEMKERGKEVISEKEVKGICAFLQALPIDHACKAILELTNGIEACQFELDTPEMVAYLEKELVHGK